jgi:hypothetical protein
MSTTYLADSLGSLVGGGLTAVLSPQLVFLFAGGLMLASVAGIAALARTRPTTSSADSAG